MLVGAREEVDPAALHAAEPGDEVGGHGGVGMPQMGHVIDVIDGGGDVEDGVAHIRLSLTNQGFFPNLGNTHPQRLWWV